MSRPGSTRGVLWRFGTPQAYQIAKVRLGEIGAGAPAASLTAPTVSGMAQLGRRLTCAAGTWSVWAGQEPMDSGFIFDGFSWLRDGAPIPGATGTTYTPAKADVGQRVSCMQTVTYQL